MSEKKNSEATYTFQNAIQYASADEKGIIYYHAANNQTQMGNKVKAKEYLMKASEDRSVARSARRALQELNTSSSLPELKVAQPGRWSVSGGIKYGYDDNVLLFSENTLATVSQTETASTSISPSINCKNLDQI